jgi:hypothetical protein
MDNANPTVLNLTDLPTRRGKNGGCKKKAPGSEIQELLEMKSRYVIQDFELSDPESLLESDDDATVDPIDEQEIYGMTLVALLSMLILIEAHRSHLYHFRSGASAVPWLTGRRQPTGYPHHSFTLLTEYKYINTRPR